MTSSYQHLIAVEQPLPWPDDPLDAAPPALAHMVEQLWDANVPTRVLAIAPDPAYSHADTTRVVYVRRPERAFAQFVKWEYHVPPAAVWELVAALLHEQASAYDQYRQPSQQVRDLLVCTHGTVDACCGKFGFPLYAHLRTAYATDALRVWRCSHFGGHRFAPTLLDLPDGRCWAYLTSEILAPLIQRRGPVAALRNHYRGWGGMRSVFTQIAEREVWMREGWAWLSYHSAARVLAVDPAGQLSDYPQFADRPPRWAEVQIDYAAPDGSTAGAYLARLEIGRTIQIGGCGEGNSTIHQYQVTHLEQLATSHAPARS